MQINSTRNYFLAGILLLATGGLASAANLVVNGSFEGSTYVDQNTGDLMPSGWTVGPPSPATLSKLNVSSATNAATDLGPQDGAYYMRFQSTANNGTRDCLLQDLHTTAGQIYNVSFWVADTSTSVGNTVGLNPVWDENTANQSTMGASQFYYAPTNTSPVPYQFFSFTEVASTNLTRIDFHGIDANGSILVDNVVVSPVPALWKSAVSGSWSSTGNWTGGVVPNAAGAGAVFSAATTAALTVTLDKPETVGTLQFGNSSSASVGYTLSGGGSNNLTLSNSGDRATITLTGGSHVIHAPVVLAENLAVSGSGKLTFDNLSSITGSGKSLTMSASNATLILSGSDNYSGGTFVNAGMLTVTNANAIADRTSLTVGSTAAFAPVVPSTSATSAVPEPGPWALLMTSAAVIAMYRKRCRHRPIRGARKSAG
jgi:autotransporter-associated beta strand protein